MTIDWIQMTKKYHPVVKNPNHLAARNLIGPRRLERPMIG